MEHIFTRKQNIMRVNGMQTSAVAGDECTMLMDRYMKENGTTTKEMGKEC